MTMCKVVFEPFDASVDVEPGTTLLEAAGRAGIAIESPCGGDGICGRCKVIVKEGRVGGAVSGLLTRDEIRQGYVLACQTFVESDLRVDIPEKTRAKEKIVIDLDAQRFRAEHPGVAPREFARAPLVVKLFMDLEPPSLANNLSDCERLQARITRETGITAIQTGLKIIQRLPEILRQGGFACTATVGRRRDIAEIMDVDPDDTSDRNFAAVVDMGTTTIVVHLVDLVTGATVGTQACFNSQATYGREVTARMISAERMGPGRLQELLVEDINRLIASLADEKGVNRRDITVVVGAGNSAMTHFLLGLPTANIRRAPYIDVTNAAPPMRAAEVGIKIHRRGLLFTVPGIGGWVGGDIAAGILATGLYEMDELGMFIDVGTNGEIVLGNRDWLMACSASAGPALEGASVACGMMAERGAIEKVALDNGHLRCDVIGGGPAEGICGSGIIDAVAALLEAGAINRAGKFIERDDPRLRFEDGQGRFTLCDGSDVRGRSEIYVAQEDIDAVVTAKAAIFAASKIMLDRLGLKLTDVKKLFIAGGFGSRIDLANALAIGLLPDLPAADVQFVGNTSIWGGKLAALSVEAYHTLGEITSKTTCYDLMGAPDYVEQFQQAMFLPHTNIELFPSQTAGEHT